MLSFLAFMLLGIYHIYVINPEMFNIVKMVSIFSIIQAQMFIEHSINEVKTLWHKCNKYIQNNIIIREKMFTNPHILECNVVSYDLSNDTITTIPYNFKTLMSYIMVPSDGIIITEIKFDTLETIRLTTGYMENYSMGQGMEMIEQKFPNGYPERVQSPFICVEVMYDGNRYDLTNSLKEYLYAGNRILSSRFVRMLMRKHLNVYIKPSSSFSLHTVDQHVHVNDIHFNDVHVDYVYEL
jgi:hypothetical protein